MTGQRTPSRDTPGMDRETVKAALKAMGIYLREHKAFAEICLFGGSAIMFLFDWRRSTKDVDVVIRNGDDHALLLAARKHAAKVLNLPENWLNDAVTQFASASAAEQDKLELGLYPDPMRPALRVMTASPEYLFAMKVVALDDRRAERDLKDAIRIGQKIGISSEADVLSGVHRFFPDYEFSEGDTASELAAAIKGRAPP